jgi:hypothetical protein
MKMMVIVCGGRERESEHQKILIKKWKNYYKTLIEKL